MLSGLHSSRTPQLVIGLLMGMAFGFLLHKGGITDYDVIIGQLLLTDCTVVKIMLSAAVIGMVGVYVLRSLGLAQLHPKSGSIGSSAVGGLIFGAGFGVLGYCPGTVAGAVGRGALDALLGGAPGILIGAGLLAAAYPRLQRCVLAWGNFGTLTIPEVFRVSAWAVVPPAAAALVAVLVVLERSGL